MRPHCSDVVIIDDALKKPSDEQARKVAVFPDLYNLASGQKNAAAQPWATSRHAADKWEEAKTGKGKKGKARAGLW